jgi:hypothetical protein
MIELLAVVLRVLSILVSLLPAVVWHFAPGQPQSRGPTFFGVRVEPGFSKSKSGLTILREFRLRLWMCASAVAVISSVMPLGLAAFAGSLINWFAGLGTFVLAYRRTRREA